MESIEISTVQNKFKSLGKQEGISQEQPATPRNEGTNSGRLMGAS